MSNVLLVAMIVAALAGAEAVYYLARYFGERKHDELRRRLRTVGDPGSGPQIVRRRRLATSGWASDFLGSFPVFEKIEALIEQTDHNLTVARLLGTAGALASVGLFAGVGVRNPALGATLAAIGAVSAFLWLVNERTKRSAKLSEQLPDALEMMARSIKAGHALPTSFKLVAQECPTPIAVEFAKAYEQQNLGVPFEQTVLNMTTRVPKNLDLRLFAVSIVIQKETGGNLVEVLENISTTLRERFKFFSKLRALTAEGKISGIILGSLPFLVAFLVGLTNPKYLTELGEGLGRVVLLVGITCWLMGIAWIRKLMKVEY